MRSWRSQVTSSRTQSAAARAGAPQYPSEAEFNSFNTLPLEQKVEHASVIVITRFQRQGNSLKAIITDIPKQRPGTSFYYSVGQEFTEVSAYQEAGTEYGDGTIIFLVGNPAQMVESYSYSKDRIGGLGSMPLQTFRELAAKSK